MLFEMIASDLMVQGVGKVRPAKGRVVRDRVDEPTLKSGALSTAILNSANFPFIAADERGIVRLFNAGARLMLGYETSGVIDKITPANVFDAHELSTRSAMPIKEHGVSMDFEQQVLARISENNTIDIQMCISDYQLIVERQGAVLVNLKTGARNFIAFADTDSYESLDIF